MPKYILKVEFDCSLTTDSSTVTLLRLRLRYESITQKQYLFKRYQPFGGATKVYLISFT